MRRALVLSFLLASHQDAASDRHTVPTTQWQQQLLSAVTKRGEMNEYRRLITIQNAHSRLSSHGNASDVTCTSTKAGQGKATRAD